MAKAAGKRGTMSRMGGWSAAALLAAMAAGPAVALPAAAGAAVPDAAAFRAEADALLRASFPADGPGAAAIVTRGGKVIWSGGVGLADLQTRSRITPKTPMMLGSIVKQVTAATVLKLVEEGRISLDDPVARFFPDWPQPGGSATVRQLLNHSSGIQDFSKIPGWIGRNRLRAFTTDALLEEFRDLPARAEPGHAWEYSNGGYVLLGAIVEKVTGRPWHEALAERVTRPLGLATLAHAGTPGIAIATGHGVEDGRTVPVPRSHPSVPHAAGGLVGSVEDLARFANALHHGRIVGPDLYEEMLKPARLADGSPRPYGFGLRLQAIRGRRALVHGGAGGGLDTDSVYIPGEDIYVAVFANSEDPATDPSNLTRRLAALALGEPIPTFSRSPVDMAAVEPLFGLYTPERGPPRRFFARDGKLYLGQGEFEREAFSAGGGRFFFGPGDLDWFHIVRATDGAHRLEMNGPERAAPIAAIRTGDVPPPFTVAAEVLRGYTGRYATETVEVKVALDPKGRLTMEAAGQPPMPMRPVSDTEFRLDGTPMRVVFHPENGAVNRFTLYRGARALHGKRLAD